MRKLVVFTFYDNLCTSPSVVKNLDFHRATSGPRLITSYLKCGSVSFVNAFNILKLLFQNRLQKA